MSLRPLVLAAAALALAACASSGGAAVKPYPIDTCLVTGTKLGAMGDVVVKVYDGQEIRFCCDPCVDEFEADPAKFLRLLPR
jgi:hypothetical protein